MKDKVRNVCELLIGILFVLTAILGYYKDINHMDEYCFISGMTVGIIFIFSFFFFLIKKRRLPLFIYFDCMIMILMILIATLAIGLNLNGAFWFIHIINPILLFLYWCVFCDHNDIYNAMVATNIVFPICYIAFAFIVWKTTDDCPFPVSLILTTNPWYIVLAIIVGLCILFLLVGYLLHYMNKYVHRKLRVMKQDLSLSVKL